MCTLGATFGRCRGLTSGVVHPLPRLPRPDARFGSGFCAQDRMRERSELGASSGHLDPETDGSMDLDCWIHGSMDLHW
eukprot:scaffold14096_cov66-Phaeocystis_antarctica.AAC.1